MFIKVKIENNKKFKLEGYDLVTDLYISPWEAALGKKIRIESIEDSVEVCLNPGVQSGERIKFKEKGYKDGKGGRGNLIAEIKTVVPKELTKEEKNLFEKLNNISKFNPRA